MSNLNHKIGVIGLGYVGLPLAVSFSEITEVVGFDISKNRVNELNDKSADQLRALYREKLRQPPHEGSKGASIGLVEVARRTSAPLSCAVEDTNQGYSFFMIKARI